MNYIFNQAVLVALLAIPMTSSVSSLEKIALNTSSVTIKKQTELADNFTATQNKKADNVIAQQENLTEPNSGIQEGQFVNSGFDNQLTVELLNTSSVN